jgi:3'-phosphoadenosine 5'-phosphosulfate sulfotransferase (PAPS reductase)/FAD synthetase
MKAEAHAHLDRAIEKFRPIRSFVMFSGGKDSLSTALVLEDHPAFEGVCFIDTGIGVRDTLQFVRETAHERGWPLYVVKPPYGTYRALVLKYGFPGPGAHRYPYIQLKEKPIRKFCVGLKSTPQARENVLLITGVRRQESMRRMGTVKPWTKEGSRVWVAPILGWTGQDVRGYLDHRGVKENPVSAVLGFSGECLCGAFAKTLDRDTLKMFYPEAEAEIAGLEAEAQAAGVPCRWGKRPPKAPPPEAGHFAPMCEGCAHA